MKTFTQYYQHGDSMWEITIKSNLEHQNALTYISTMLFDHFANKVVIGRYAGRTPCLSIATKDEFKNEVWDFLRRLLCDVFCEQFKYEFLENNITFISSESKFFQPFIKVYTYFDLELEHSIAYRMLECMPSINLESYLNFKLHPLKNKWKDLCNITNNNSSAFLSSETFLSLLKFLIDNLDYRTDSVVVSLQDNCMLYEDKSTNEQVFQALDKNEMQVICSLIDLSPRKIIVHKNAKMHDLQQLIVELFDTRVQTV